MYSLFNDPLSIKRGGLRFPDYDYVYRGLRRNLDTVLKYCRTNPSSVSSDHFIVKLIESVSVSSHLPVAIYRDRVEDIAEDLSMSLKLTSPLSLGRVFEPGVFYGPGSDEILISHSQNYSDSYLEGDWENFQPITFLMHPKSDLGFDVPRGEQNNLETGHSVIAIDIPLLMCQYRMWRQRERRLNPDDQKTVMQFVSMYVLPNMLESQFHLALFNRLHRRLNGFPGTESGLRKPYYLNDLYERLDRNLDAMLVNYRKLRYDYDQVLEAIALGDDTSLRDIIKLPPMPHTRQVTWVLTLARLPVMEFLAKISADTPKTINRTLDSKIKRSFQNLLSNRSMYSVLGRHGQDEVVLRLSQAVELILNK